MDATQSQPMNTEEPMQEKSSDEPKTQNMDLSLGERASMMQHKRGLYAEKNGNRCRWPCFAAASNSIRSKGFHQCKRKPHQEGLCQQHHYCALNLLSAK